MPEKTELHLVFGACGALGNTLVHELHKQGKTVTGACSDGKADVPDGVKMIRADAADRFSARVACKDATVVYHCACPAPSEWREKFVPITEGIIDATAFAGAKLIFADNLDAYGEVTGAIKETLPLAASGKKSKVRAEALKLVLEAHKEGKLKAVVGKASDFYGPRVTKGAMGARIFENVLNDKKASVIGNIKEPHTFTYIEDFAKALIKLSEDSKALGEVWHVPSGKTVTGEEFLEIIFKQAKKEKKVSGWSSVSHKFKAMSDARLKNFNERLYAYEKPFTVDHSKFLRTFKMNPTSHQEGIKKTLDWYSKRVQS